MSDLRDVLRREGVVLEDSVVIAEHWDKESVIGFFNFLESFGGRGRALDALQQGEVLGYSLGRVGVYRELVIQVSGAGSERNGIPPGFFYSISNLGRYFRGEWETPVADDLEEEFAGGGGALL